MGLEHAEEHHIRQMKNEISHQRRGGRVSEEGWGGWHLGRQERRGGNWGKKKGKGISKRAHLLGTRNEWTVTFMTKTIKKGEHC